MNCPRFIAFDIETRPIPAAVTKFTRDFHEFDEAAVKVGNLKDPAKIAEKLISARAEHDAARVAYYKNANDRAALDPFTGAIVCIGIVAENGEPEIIAEATEEATIRQFWQMCSISDHALTKFVFWSGSGDISRKFDLDFIVTRSRINRVPLPHRVRNGRWYADRFVDMAGEFLLYQRDRYLSLTKAAELFGLYASHADIKPKRDDDLVRGENFYAWWDGLASPERTPAHQQALAREYLLNDLRLTRYLAPFILT